MPTTTDTLLTKCPSCGGTGKLPASGSGEQQDCKKCSGSGMVELGKISDVEDFTLITDKLDAIKAMLDSTVCGLQKMSSNLDDIMVKLDV